MKRRLFLVWSIAGVILVGAAHLSAQNRPGLLAVNEPRARAVLASPSIRLQLPFAAPAITAGRAVVWTLSPTGTASAETAADFQASARQVNLTVPWPQDEKGKPADDVGWYRIAYRIETANSPPLNGILSIGAIAPELLTLRLALPENLVSGKLLSVRVYAGNPVTRRGFRGVRLEGTPTSFRPRDPVSILGHDLKTPLLGHGPEVMKLSLRMLVHGRYAKVESHSLHIFSSIEARTSRR